MQHRLHVIIVIVVLLSFTIITGLLVAQAVGLRFSRIDAFLNPTITGAAVAACSGDNCPASLSVCAEKTGTACRIACYDDSDCDDRISATADVCKNPGTEFSLCVNKLLH